MSRTSVRFRRIAAPAVVVGGLALVPLLAQTPAINIWHGVDRPGMDTSVSACQDFYQYANGKWLASNPIPADRTSWGTGSMISEKNLQELHDILEAAAKDTAAPKGSATRLVGDFYRSGMDEALIQTDAAKPLAPEFAKIAAIHDEASLQDEIARLHTFGLGAAFGLFINQDLKDSSKQIVWLYQAGLGLPDRDYYFNDDDKSKEIRAAYVPHIAKMLTLAGDPADKADAEAKRVMDFETALAKVSQTVTEQRDPAAVDHGMSVDQLSDLTPGWSWPTYFAAIGLPSPGHLNVGQPEFFKAVGGMVAKAPIDDWKTYLRWQLINTEAARLSDDFVNEDFKFNGTIIGGAKELRPRWKRVLQATDAGIGEALGQLYVAKAFTPATKQRALTMVQNLKAALRDRIQAIDWIGEATRKQALVKLDAMGIKIGYPDKWRDYTALSTDSPSYVTNGMAADAFEFRRNIKKVGHPIDRTEWGMTPPTVDAYNSSQFNEIVFPAGILQPPLFDPTQDDAINYGAMGAVIGHELTHGFDDQGRQFDAKGNLKDWWTADDAKNFAARAKIIEDQYNGYVAVDDLHINGKLTLGENIADFGGLKIAYVALQKALAGKPKPADVDGLTTDQRFFLAYAQSWRRNTRPEAIRLLVTTDPHSPPPYRVMGAISNTPEFAAAFGCKAGDAMVRAENLRPRIW
jgi:putative endopeptidase